MWSLSGLVRSRWSDALLMPTILAGNQYNHQHRSTTTASSHQEHGSSLLPFQELNNQPPANGFAQPLSGLVQSHWSDVLLMPTILAGNQYNHHCGTTAVTKGRRGMSSSPLSRRSYHLVVWSLSGLVRSRWSDVLLMPMILAGNQYNHQHRSTTITKGVCHLEFSSKNFCRK